MPKNADSEKNRCANVSNNWTKYIFHFLHTVQVCTVFLPYTTLHYTCKPNFTRVMQLNLKPYVCTQYVRRKILKRSTISSFFFFDVGCWMMMGVVVVERRELEDWWHFFSLHFSLFLGYVIIIRNMKTKQQWNNNRQQKQPS